MTRHPIRQTAIHRLLFLMLMVAAQPAPAAQEEAVRIPSTVMKRDIPAMVVLPNASATEPSRRFPTLYLLHGAGDNERSWLDRTPVREMADQYGVIIVTPATGTSWYFDSPEDPSSQFETFVTSELVAFMDSHYRTLARRSSRALAGNSMGGHGSMFLAVRHKDVFCAAAPMSGGMDIRASDPNVGAFPNNWGIKQRLGPIEAHPERWDSLTVINVVNPLKNGELAISIDCGNKDFFLECNRALHAKLTAQGVVHDYAEHPGGHGWDYWKLALPRQMAFLSRHLEGAVRQAVPSEAACIALDGLPAEPNKIGAKGLIERVDAPRLRLLRTTAKTPAGTVLILPSGGYQVLSMVSDGLNKAKFWNDLGYDAAILEYSLAGLREQALKDALAAVALVNQRAKDFGLHRGTFILMGHSAGGHLATRVVSKLPDADRPDALVLFYPAYLDEVPPGAQAPGMPIPQGKLPLLFSAIGTNDNANWIKSTSAYAEAWKKAGGTAEYHLLPNAGHGFYENNSAQAWSLLLKDFATKMKPR